MPSLPPFLRAWLLVVATTASAANWPSWRGDVAGSGHSTEAAVPTKWSATESVLWKVPLPERGNSTPIVWGDRVFVTQAIGSRRALLSFARKDGAELWRQGPTYAAAEPSHPTNPYCSASPVTDGERVIAWFGSAGLYCYDFAGQEQWHLDLGPLDHEWGYGTSPVLYKNLCILYFGPGSNGFLLAVDKRTGKQVWRVELPPERGPVNRTDGFAGKEGIVGSFSTPIVIEAAGRTELIMALPGRVRSFVPETGKDLWRCEGLTPLVYSSLISGDGIVVAMTGYGGSELAMAAGRAGQVQPLWEHRRTKLRLGSGVVYQGHIYILSTPGVAQCLDLKSGETIWEERLRGPSGRSESWSSMLLVGDLLYILDQAGETFILRAAPKFEQVAVNPLNDGLTNSSHAISDGQIFIRTHRHLWCLGEKREK